jgi:hypothetical protein
MSIDIIYNLMKQLERRTISKMQHVAKQLRRAFKKWIEDADQLEAHLTKLEQRIIQLEKAKKD